VTARPGEWRSLTPTAVTASPFKSFTVRRYLPVATSGAALQATAACGDFKFKFSIRRQACERVYVSYSRNLPSIEKKIVIVVVV